MSEPATSESLAASSPIGRIKVRESSWPSLLSVVGTYERNGEVHTWNATCTVYRKSSDPKKPHICNLKVSLTTDVRRAAALTSAEEALFEAAILKYAENESKAPRPFI